MSTKQLTSNMKACEIVTTKVTEFFLNIIRDMKSDMKGKIKLSKLEESFESCGKGLYKIILPCIPKNTRQKKLKDPNAPKKPLTKYMSWANDNRARVKFELINHLDEHPKPTEVTRELGIQWNKLKEDGKTDKKMAAVLAKYETEYKEQKAEFDIQMKDYTRPTDEELSHLSCNQKKPRKSSNGSKKKTIRDPNMPKKPASVYIRFGKIQRPIIRKLLEEKSDDFTGTDVSKALGEKWNELKEQKDKYLTLSPKKQNKTKYSKLKTAYDEYKKMEEEYLKDVKIYEKEMESYKEHKEQENDSSDSDPDDESDDESNEVRRKELGLGGKANKSSDSEKGTIKKVIKRKKANEISDEESGDSFDESDDEVKPVNKKAKKVRGKVLSKANKSKKTKKVSKKASKSKKAALFDMEIQELSSDSDSE